MYKVLRIALKVLLCLALVPVALLTIAVVVVAGCVRPFSRPWSRCIARLMPLTIWSVMHGIFLLSIKMDAPPVPQGSCLVISNHVGAADFMIINALNRFNFTRAKYVIKQSLRFFPVFYQGCLLADFIVVRRSFEHDRKHIAKQIQDFVRRKAPLWLILYPEGHRVTSDNLAESREFCVAKNMQPYEHVLCPRYKGFDLICSNLQGSHVRKVLDVTLHCTSGAAPSLFQILFSTRVFEFKCDVRAIDIDSVSSTRQFVEDIFRRKDQLIGEWKRSSKH